MKLDVIGEMLKRESFFAEANFTYKWGVENKKMIEGLILDKENHYEAIPVFLALLNSEEFASEYCFKKYEYIGCKTTLRYFTWFTKKDGFMLFAREYGKEESVHKTKKLVSLSDFSFRRSYDLMSELERGLGRELTASEVNQVVELFIEAVQDTTKYNDPIDARIMRENFIGSFLTVLNMGVLLDKTYKKNKKKIIQVLVEYDWGYKMSINYAMAFAQSMGGQLTKRQVLTWIRTNNFKNEV